MIRPTSSRKSGEGSACLPVAVKRLSSPIGLKNVSTRLLDLQRRRFRESSHHQHSCRGLHSELDKPSASVWLCTLPRPPSVTLDASWRHSNARQLTELSRDIQNHLWNSSTAVRRLPLPINGLKHLKIPTPCRPRQCPQALSISLPQLGHSSHRCRCGQRDKAMRLHTIHPSVPQISGTTALFLAHHHHHQVITGTTPRLLLRTDKGVCTIESEIERREQYITERQGVTKK